jgi:DNA polymerase-1
MEDITKEERDKIKVVVFSTLFGSEGDSAARSLMIPIDEARSYVYKFFERFKEIDALKVKLEELAKRTTYTKTIYGRPRKLPKIHGDYSARAHALRQAMNTAIQGSVADMLKIAIAKTRKYNHLGLEFVIGVFDSLLISVPLEMTEDVYVPIIEELSTFGNLKLKFEYAEGPNWRYVQDQT